MKPCYGVRALWAPEHVPMQAADGAGWACVTNWLGVGRYAAVSTNTGKGEKAVVTV